MKIICGALRIGNSRRNYVKLLKGEGDFSETSLIIKHICDPIPQNQS